MKSDSPLPLFEAFYELDEKDNTTNIDDIKSTVANALSDLYDETFGTSPDEDQVNDRLKKMLLNNGMWWSKSFEKDLSRLYSHLDGKYPAIKSDMNYAVKVVSDFLYNEYQQDSPNDDIDVEAVDDFDAHDKAILMDPSFNKSEKIRRLAGRYKPSEIAKAVGTSSQVVRNVIKKMR